MSKGSRTDLCGGWPERAIPTATVGVPSMRTHSTAEGSRGLARGVKEVLGPVATPVDILQWYLPVLRVRA